MPKVKYTAEEQEIFEKAKKIRLCRKFGIEPPKTARQYTAEYRKELKAAALSVTREKRQEIMDCIFEGMMLGAVAEKFGVKWEVIAGTLQINRKVEVIRIVSHRRESL